MHTVVADLRKAEAAAIRAKAALVAARAHVRALRAERDRVMLDEVKTGSSPRVLADQFGLTRARVYSILAPKE